MHEGFLGRANFNFYVILGKLSIKHAMYTRNLFGLEDILNDFFVNFNHGSFWILSIE
jgi:hypothetical protein